MKREALASRLHLSTIGSDSRTVAVQYGLGLEIATFCTAANLDQDAAWRRATVLKDMSGLGSFWFHAPFAELSHASIDPKVRAVTALRYRQAVEMATSLGISRLVIHSGFIPLVYFPEWFVEQSVVFWREFLREIPAGIAIALENVMEPGPEPEPAPTPPPRAAPPETAATLTKPEAAALPARPETAAPPMERAPP